MVRHIILWKFTEEVKRSGKEGEVLALLRASAAGMVGKIDGLRSAEIGKNTAGGEYDFVYCADFDSPQALAAYQHHPLHEAHKARSKPYVCGRLVADYLR